jgi:hypothetical protein
MINKSRYLREYIITEVKDTYLCMAGSKGEPAYITKKDYERLLVAESTEVRVKAHVEREGKVFKGVKY